jgi:hypothetical protein
MIAAAGQGRPETMDCQPQRQGMLTVPDVLISLPGKPSRFWGDHTTQTVFDLVTIAADVNSRPRPRTVP